MEGVVKYTLSHTETLLPASLLYDTSQVQALDRLRTDFVDKGFIGIESTGIGCGNISCRIRSGMWNRMADAFLISGTGTGQHRVLGVHGYALITKACANNNTIEAQGRVAPSSEALSHAALYAACPKVNIILHGHHMDVYTFGLRSKAPITDASIIYGTPAMAKAIESLVTGNVEGFFIMGGHENGFFVYGGDIATVQRQCKALAEHAKKL